MPVDVTMQLQRGGLGFLDRTMIKIDIGSKRLSPVRPAYDVPVKVGQRSP